MRARKLQEKKQKIGVTRTLRHCVNLSWSMYTCVCAHRTTGAMPRVPARDWARWSLGAVDGVENRAARS